MSSSFANANRLLDKFPKIVPSYERILTKKEHAASLFSIIPKGVKSYLWFTFVEDKNVCCLLTLDNKKRIHSIDYHPMCFNSTLSMGRYGTILYGTSFYSYCEKGYKVKCFSCEDIMYYIGNKMEWQPNTSFLTSNELIDLFTRQIKQAAYNKNFIVCGLPIITRQFSDAHDLIKNLPYNAYGIQQRTSFGQVIGITIIRPNTTPGEYKDTNPITIIPHHSPHSPPRVLPDHQIIKNKINSKINNTSGVVFKVTPSLHPDIYQLHCLDSDSKEECDYGIAMIPSYKSSVFMNGLFRNIKENRNLDLLEESDDEEEFQNNKEDKFVHLEKCLFMKCVFNKKFNKWQPINVVNETDSLVTKKEVLFFEQNSK